MPKDKFKKSDSGKPMLSLIDPEWILGTGRVLTIGGIKYEIENWKKGNTLEGIQRIKDALLRHTMAYMSGERFDPETKESHLYHINCNTMFLDYFDRLNSDV